MNPGEEPMRERAGPENWLVNAGVVAIILFMLIAPPIAVLSVVLAYHGLRMFSGLQ